MSEQSVGNRRDKISVWLILLIPVAVIATSSFVFFSGIGMPSGTTNQGVLIIPPLDIKPISFRDAAEKEFRYADQPFKWGLIIPGQTECDKACQQTLYFTRQMQTALGRLGPSLRRYFLVSDSRISLATADMLARDNPDVTVLYARQSDRAAIFEQFKNAPPASSDPYFLVDPGGFLMMYYTSRHTHKQFLSDLKFLIKESGET